MSDQLLKLSKSGTPTHDSPPVGDIISGDPQFTSWKLDSADGLTCGMWECTPGKWSTTYKVWEYIHILEGKATITPEDDEPVELSAGDSFVLRVGLRCTWDVKQTILKEFVIRS